MRGFSGVIKLAISAIFFVCTVTFAEIPLPLPNILQNEFYEKQHSKLAALPMPMSGSPTAKLIRQKMPKLTLRDAIFLEIRNNPDVRNAELDRVTQKFALAVAHNEFEPTYTFGGDATFAPGSCPVWGLDPTVSIKTPLGTQLKTTLNNDINAGHETSATLQVTQPLLKGLGSDVVLAALHDAEDAERINELALKSTLMSNVSTIVTNYYNVVQAYLYYDVIKQQLKQAKKEYDNSKLRVQVGKLAASQLIQEQSSLSSQQLSLATQENTIEQNYQTLLTSLGLDPRAKLTVDKAIDDSNMNIPLIKKSIDIALANDTTYRTDILNIKIDHRAILTAKDALKPQLDLVATETHVLSSSGNFIDSSGVITDLQNPGARSLKFTLSVPLDDRKLQQTLITSKINLAKAKITLAKDRRALITTIINDIRNLKSQKEQIKLAEETVKYSQQVYIKINYVINMESLTAFN